MQLYLFSAIAIFLFYFKVPTIYTVLFLDEVNTTEAIGLVKEVLCDGRMLGKSLSFNSTLKIVAACNPYRKYVTTF